MRSLWIQKINAATRIYGLNYNIFTLKSKQVDLALNRKVLADLAVNEPMSFKAIVDVVKKG
jgi:large subunit ribosomal protein L20